MVQKLLINQSINQSIYLNTDCRYILRELINNKQKCNLILVDPPYGIAHKSNRRKDKADMTTRKGILNDINNQDLLEEVIHLSYECLEDNSHIYWFTRWDKLDEQLPMLRKYYNIKNLIIWDKGNRGSGDLTGSYGNRYECIIYGMKGRKPLNIVDGTQRHDDILNYSKISAKKLIHPHQKPLELLEFLVNKSTKENDLVLDMFSGVGSTLIASENNNRRCIAIELDSEVYNKGITYIKENIHN